MDNKSLLIDNGKVTKVPVSDIAIHSLANKHRKMNQNEFDALVEDISINGQLVPAIMYRGKIVDGRHRLRALKKLNVGHILCISLKNNLSLREVEETVLSSENRRSDSIAQKSIRALRHYQKYPEMGQAYVAKRFGVSRVDVSLAKTLEAAIGSESVDEFYREGSLQVGGKTYTNIRALLNFIKKNKVERRKVDEFSDLTELEKDVLDKIHELAALGKSHGLLAILNTAKAALGEMIKGE